MCASSPVILRAADGDMALRRNLKGAKTQQISDTGKNLQKGLLRNLKRVSGEICYLHWIMRYWCYGSPQHLTRGHKVPPPCTVSPE